jgi:hypothetical protein
MIPHCKYDMDGNHYTTKSCIFDSIFYTKSAKLSQPTGQKLSNVRRQQNKFSIGPILFLCYEGSLVSTNLNSKQLRFYCAHPNKRARSKASTEKDVMDTNLFVFSLHQLSFLHSLFVFCFFQARIRSRNEFGMSAETILDHFSTFDIQGKDIYPKYYEYLAYALAQKMRFLCSKMINHG